MDDVSVYHETRRHRGRAVARLCGGCRMTLVGVGVGVSALILGGIG
ncbi:hypothetical protein [Micromonospora sp. CPCC 205561]